MSLSIRPVQECAFDCISPGEVMLRLNPGEGRNGTSRSFRAWEGGGIFAALSEGAARFTIEAVKAANKPGTVESYGLNYRPSLWNSIGGGARVDRWNKEYRYE